MKNTNAATGKKGETLFRDSLADYPEVIEKIRIAYKIPADFTGTMRTSTGEKCDVKVDFDGRNIDASIKSYAKHDEGFNQIARWSIDNFAKNFGISDAIREDLRNLVVAKSHNPRKNHLFPLDKRDEYREIFEPLSRDLIKKSFSNHPSREILVLFDEQERTIRIWRMYYVVNRISTDIDYSPRGGNMVIGGCFEFQRKGGNGEKYKSIPKTSPTHPGNGVQTKLRMKKFIELHYQNMLVEYQV